MGNIEVVQEGEVEASMAEQDAAQGDVGLWQLFRESFDEFVNNIVVPPRASYTHSTELAALSHIICDIYLFSS